MTDLPMPLVPADVDLRDFPCLQIDIVRLFSSEFHALSSDAEWRAGMTLWLKSFHQVPAASLPDDDTALARLAEFGRDQASWKEAKAGALRNWVKCSDGRLYHPTVAIKALEAWLGKLLQRRAGTVGNAKRWKIEPNLKEFDDAYAAAFSALAALDPRSNALFRHRPSPSALQSDSENNHSRPDAGHDHEPNATATTSPSQPDRDPIPEGSHCDRDPSPDPDRGRIASEVKLSEVNNKDISSLRSDIDHRPAGKPRAEPNPRKHAYPNDAFTRWYADYPHKVGKGAAKKAFAKVQASDVVDFTELLDGLRRYRQTKPHDRPWCNPATWLNEERWADAPASTSGASPPSSSAGSSINFGNGCSASAETIRKFWSSGRWPPDWGPRPGQQGCRIPPEMAAELVGEHAA